MIYWRQRDRRISHKMDLRFGTYCPTLLIVLLSSICVQTIDNQISEDLSSGSVFGSNNYTTDDYYISSKRGLYNNSNPGYGSSMYYQSPAYNQYMQVMYSGYNYNYRAPTLQSIQYQSHGYNQSYASAQQLYNQTQSSPYQTLPGTYGVNSYNKMLYNSGNKYSAQDIYGSYLTSGAYQYYSMQCANHYGQIPQISTADMESAFSYAYHQLQGYDQQYGNYSSYSSQSPPLQLKEREAILMEYVTQYFAKFKCLSKYQTSTFLPTVTIGQQYMQTNRYGDTSCYSSYGGKGYTLQCPDYNSKYRTIDGSCNNLKHPYWGKSYICHIRLLPPDYADGVSAPRRALDGSSLPSSRTLSNIMTSDKPFQSFYTHLKMSFGQFVNHDITHTPVHGSYALSSSYNGAVDCCRTRNNKQCYPIEIEPTPYDYQYRKYNNTCINFVRSAPCPLCEIGPRQQSNIATSFIDAGTVYGNTQNESVVLRTYRFGLLKTSKDQYGKPILLATPAPYQNECSPPTASMQCFTAGDQRCNQHPSLMCMHLIMLRRHNQHSTALRLVNPQWNDEILFQEARRLCIAELQHITFNEYLPIVFGPTLMNYYSLNPLTKGYSQYEPNTDPTTWNDYATSACRFGHSQIRGLHSVYGKGGNMSDSYWLRDRYMDPSYLWEGKMDGMLKGLVNDYSYSVDPYYTKDITNYLMRKKGDLFGSDLIARNIQRGRDHGIPGYVNYLKFCFGYEVRSWDDLKLFIPEHTINLFKQVYKKWENIDFYIAGISERHFPDADIGPTFACVLGIQYYHVKFGDRYFYEHGAQSGSFNLAQLENIRKTTTLSRLVCRTGDYIPSVQRYAFFPESGHNPKIPCNKYQEIDYMLWKVSPNQSY